MSQNNTFMDRLFDRLDRLDPTNVQSYVQRLVREKGFLETIFNTIHEGVMVLDSGLRIRYSNRAARDMLGVPDGADGRKLSRFVRDVDWESLIENFTASGRRMGVHEIEVFYPQNRLLTFYMVPHPRDGEESSEGERYTLIFRDVTVQRRSTEAAIESEKVEAITQLAAGVAHEIGNPLNSLTIHLQLLSRGLEREGVLGGESADEARELLRVALQEVSRLDSITNEFLRAVRPTMPTMSPVRLEEVLADALGFMRREIEDRGVRVEASLPDQMPVVYGEVAQLKQVFFNLFKNSLQAMGEGGMIMIDCRVGSDYVELRFTDTGKGIARENLGRILDPYFTTRPDGTGLGLLIVERIVRAHGGEIGIESEEGEGTTVSVRLPRRERQARLLTAAQPATDDQESG